MTSSSVYLAISGISATISNPVAFSPVGSVTKGSTLLSMMPQDLSSVLQHRRGYTAPWSVELRYIISNIPSSGAPYATEGIGAHGAYVWDFVQTAESYNLFNLQRPVPGSAYFFTPPDAYGRYVHQTTIYEDYHARIAVPQVLRQLDPTWSTCLLDLDGIYDPPRECSTIKICKLCLHADADYGIQRL